MFGNLSQWWISPTSFNRDSVEAASALRQILSATVGGLRFLAGGNGVRDGWHFTYIRGHEIMTKEEVVGLSNFEDCDKFVEGIFISLNWTPSWRGNQTWFLNVAGHFEDLFPSNTLFFGFRHNNYTCFHIFLMSFLAFRRWFFVWASFNSFLESIFNLIVISKDLQKKIALGFKLRDDGKGLRKECCGKPTRGVRTHQPSQEWHVVGLATKDWQFHWIGAFYSTEKIGTTLQNDPTLQEIGGKKHFPNSSGWRHRHIIPRNHQKVRWHLRF